MVLRRATKYAVQQLSQRYGSRIQNYARSQYGEVGASIAGIGLSYLSGQDIYTAINKGIGGGKPPDGRNPPFGYFDGTDGLNGPTNGTFSQTLRSVSYFANNYRRKRRLCLVKCRKHIKSKSRKRSFRRF